MSFKEIPLDELKQYVDKDTQIIFDYDQIAYISASVVEKKTIDVVHKASGRVRSFNTKTEFCGAKKSVIEGWLGDQNVMREAKGKPSWALDEFEIINVQTNPDVSHALQAAKMTINGIRNHLGIDKYFGVIGDGNDTFRHQMLLPKKYKSNRKKTIKPILLPDTRKYLVENKKTEVVSYLEADDRLCQYGYESYLHFQKTGKLKYIVASYDKDNNHTPMIYFNTFKRKGIFRDNNPLHITPGMGQIWMHKSEVDGYGLFWLATQMLIGDDSDYIRPYQDFGIRFGDASCYKLIAKAENPTELFSLVMQQYRAWFPDGVSYTDWLGGAQSMSADEWAGMIFDLVYMKRVENDRTNLPALLKHFKVV